MMLINTDIDQILEATIDIEEDSYSFKLIEVEIDHLLEKTKEW
ncbi:hypothetical protein MGA3_06615 [Bacillus methanolicus MGA3]|uniref:Uncharacterized protein n=1 Tax=Bacillus methanolicus (strain MGA3 / ATCC 53907) TaxID=796606 RepID=I3E8Q6_BACMM|nr:hypothetical protein [Bacillus methanolicus]AIE60142.1 hypothetical protein BMMGA3_08710 [Bacillus methanolicus MGA3]EIJ82877.1 hypothetical protein MGA3_06615 [Bacillus methanolicus MGA3]